MGQGEINKLLKANHNKWFTSKEITHILNKSPSPIGVCLKRLREKNEVDFKKSGKGQRNPYFYKFKK